MVSFGSSTGKLISTRFPSPAGLHARVIHDLCQLTVHAPTLSRHLGVDFRVAPPLPCLCTFPLSRSARKRSGPTGYCRRADMETPCAWSLPCAFGRQIGVQALCHALQWASISLSVASTLYFFASAILMMSSIIVERFLAGHAVAAALPIRFPAADARINIETGDRVIVDRGDSTFWSCGSGRSSGC